ncbi:MAG: DUF4136 domain-containing protein [Candidatus Hydrogenedentota bacterium]
MARTVWHENTRVVLLVGMAILISACASTRVDRVENLPPELRVTVGTSIFESNKRLPQSGTYRIVESRIEGDRANDLSPYIDQLDSIVHQVMRENQYTLGSSGTVDLLMAYAVAATDPIKPGDLPTPVGGRAFPPGGDKELYGKGMMIVHLYDGTTREILWRGSIEAKVAIDANVSEEVREARLVHIVRKLMSNFFRVE